MAGPLQVCPLDVWSYHPQGTVVERLTDAAVVSQVRPNHIASRITPAIGHSFRVFYPQVPPSEVRSMHAFYRQHRGAWSTFIFVNPIHTLPPITSIYSVHVHAVRFANGFRTEFVDPSRYQVGPLLLHVSIGSGGTDDADKIGWGGEGIYGWGEEGWGG